MVHRGDGGTKVLPRRHVSFRCDRLPRTVFVAFPQDAMTIDD
jgi:hypothetical protein